MAQVGRARLLQLLRGTRKPQESGSVSGSGDRALVANYSSPESETPDLMDTHSRFGSAMAFSTARAPPLSCCTLCRHSSEIRTGCANQRPSGSVRGAARNGCPYRDRQLTRPRDPDDALPEADVAAILRFGSNVYWRPYLVHGSAIHGVSGGDT